MSESEGDRTDDVLNGKPTRDFENEMTPLGNTTEVELQTNAPNSMRCDTKTIIASGDDGDNDKNKSSTPGQQKLSESFPGIEDQTDFKTRDTIADFQGTNEKDPVLDNLYSESFLGENPNPNEPFVQGSFS